MADRQGGVSPKAWTFSKVLDFVGLSLLSIILLRFVDGILQASLISYSVRQLTGSDLNVSLLNDLPTYERISQLTSWADLLSGIILLAAVAVLVLPRVSWQEDGEEEWPTRARVLLIVAAVLSAIAFVAAIASTVDTVWFRTELSADPAVASIIVEGLANVVLPGVAAVLAWLSRRYWIVAEEEPRRGDAA